MKTTNSRIAISIITAAAGLSIGGFLLFSIFNRQTGFPLDDAWIHQTYARSLGLNGSWTFIPGQPSAGSTSPLWTAILSIGYFLQIPPIAFTTFVGLVCLAAAGVLFQFTSQHDIRVRLVPWYGLFAVFEWHLVWAALSGMETLLFSVLVLVTLAPLLRQSAVKPWMGVVTGIAVWVRPEGITLLAPILLTIIFENNAYKEKLRKCSYILGGFLVVVLPYLWMNNALSGSFWPNTFYAKQAEYAVLLGQPFITRVIQLAIPGLTGAGALLVPGFIWFVSRHIFQKHWGVVMAAAWVPGTLLLYASRLPVTYQHGRYLIPAMSVFFLIGLLGTTDLLSQPTDGLLRRAIRGALVWSIPVIAVAFWILGGRGYAGDVAIIETEMVAASKWINLNTPPSATIAAHDIGALGYYGDRNIIDMAGLIDPAVIPFIRDETTLGVYLKKMGAGYLFTFPGWYPSLTQRYTQIYCNSSRATIDAGGENMCVYRLVE